MSISSGGASVDALRVDVGLKPLTVTVATARKLSGLGNTTVYQLIKDKKLETVHVGRRTLIVFHSLEALLTPSSEANPLECRREPMRMPVTARRTP